MSTTQGPHSSNLANKLDPRVNSSTGTTTSTGDAASTSGNTEGSGTWAGRAPVQGSSTGAPGAPTFARHNNNNTGSASTGYNPATGTGYRAPGGSAYDQSNANTATGYNRDADYNNRDAGYNNRDAGYNTRDAGYNTRDAGYNSNATTGYNSNATTGTAGTTGNTGSSSGSSGGGLKAAVAGIHGVGESLRGTVNKAVDSAFGDKEGMAKNEAIAQEGEREVQRGEFSQSTKAREGTQRRF